MAPDTRAKRSLNALPCGRPRPTEGKVSLSGRESWKEKLNRYLAEQKLKQSSPRLKVAEILMGAETHFTISEATRAIQAKHPSIGTATIYRTVNLLADAGILNETLVGEGGETVYEIAGSEHHDHIVCVDCGNIFEFHEDAIEEAQEKATRKLKFDPVKHRHVIYAHCSYRK